MDQINITQVLTHARTILKDDLMGIELVVAAVKLTHDPVEGTVSNQQNVCVMVQAI